MAKQKETTEVEIRLRIEEAQRQIKDYTKQVETLNTALGNMGKDDAARKEALAQITELENEVAQLRNSIKSDLRIIINGEVAGKTIRDLRLAAKQLEKEIAAIDDPDSEERKNKIGQLAIINDQIRKLDQPVRDARKGLSDLGEVGSMKRLEAEAAKLREQIATLAPESQKFAQASVALGQVENKIKVVAEAAKLAKGEFNQFGAEGSLARLESDAQKLRDEIKLLAPATQDFIEKTKQLQQVERQMDAVNRKVEGSRGLFSFLSNEVKQFGILAASYLGLQALTQQISNVITKNAQLSDSIAKIQRTTGLTKQEVEELNKELGKIDTRTSTSALREIAAIGGQFNVAKQDLKGFVEEMNKVVVVMGDEFKGGAEQVTTELATLRNVMSDIKTESIATDVSKLSNALVTLSQEGVATAPVISDISNRIAGIGIPLGLTSAQVLGISATLQELGVSAERGGTAVSKILQKMASSYEDFAKIAGKTTGEFRETVNSNIYEAFLQVIEGSRQGGDAATKLAAIIKELEISGAGASEVFSKFSTNIDLIRQRVDLAGESLSNNDKITQAYNDTNNTFGGKLDRLGKQIYDVFTNSTISDFFKAAVEGTSNFITKLTELPQWISENSRTLAILSGLTLIYYANIIKAALATVGATVATQAQNASQAIANGLTATGVFLQGAYGTAIGVLTGRITLATAAQRVFNTVMSVNPIALVVTAITALYVALKTYSDNTANAIAIEKLRLDTNVMLSRTVNEVTDAQERFNNSIEKLNTLSPFAQKQLLTTIELKKRETELILEGIKAKQLELQLRESEPTVLDKVKNGFIAAGAAADATERGKKVYDEYGVKIKELENSIKGFDQQLKTLNGTLGAEAEAMSINAVSTDQYNAKLALLRTALNATVINGEDYKRILNEINKTQAELKIKIAADDVNTDEAKKKLEKFREDLNQLINQIRSVRISSIKDETQKELAGLDENYRIEREKAIDNNAKMAADDAVSVQDKIKFRQATFTLLSAMEVKHQQDREDIIKKGAKDAEQAGFDAAVNAIEDKYAKEKLLLTQNLADKIISETQYQNELKKLDASVLEEKLEMAKLYGMSIIELEQAIAEGRISARQKHSVDFAAREQEKLQLQLALAEEGSDAQLDILIKQIELERDEKIKQYENDAEMRKLYEDKANKDIEDARFEHGQRLAETQLQLMSDFASAIEGFGRLQDNLDQRELQGDKRKNEAKKKELKKQLDSNLISQDEYNSEVEKLDKELENKQKKLNREAWLRKQQADVITSFITTALNVNRALGTGPIVPNLAAGAIAAAIGAIQTATIISQPVPEFKQGTESFVPDGATHEEGGIKLFDSKKMKLVGEMEGGEAIISKQTTADKKEVIDDLVNNAGKNTYVKTFSDGGFVNTPVSTSTALPSISTTRITENIILDRFGPTSFFEATGQNTTERGGKQAVNRGGKQAVNFESDDLKQLIVLTEENNRLLLQLHQTYESTKDKKVLFVYKDYKEFEDQIILAQNNAKIG